MQTSPEINELAAALSKAQAVMKNAALNKVNPHFKSKYADLAGIRDAVTPALTANGIAVVQLLGATADHQSIITTRLMHTSGQWVESVCLIPATPDMQKMGSAITYARRYSLSAICGIAADEDEDANGAAAKSAPVQQAVAPVGVPKGFGEWLLDLEAVAQEGELALREAWKSSPADMRNFLTAQQPGKWDAIKSKAKAAAGVPA